MNKSTSKAEKTKSPSAEFVSMALDMSWRLAIVVLVPIIGGYELDNHLNTSYVFLVAGFVLALGGMVLVLWRMMQVVNSVAAPKETIDNENRKKEKQT